MAFIIFFIFFLKKFEKVEKTGIISTKYSLRCTLSVILGHHHFKFIHELGEKELGLHKDRTTYYNLKSGQKSYNRVLNDIEKKSFLHARISKIVVFPALL